MAAKGIVKGAKSILSGSMDNIAKVGLKGEYLESAITGAVAMGAVGGTTEWAQGGSFASGFKDGAVSGAALGAGYKGLKVGAMGDQWKNANVADVIGSYSSGISKQVQAIKGMQGDVAKARTVYSGAKGKTYKSNTPINYPTEVTARNLQGRTGYKSVGPGQKIKMKGGSTSTKASNLSTGASEKAGLKAELGRLLNEQAQIGKKQHNTKSAKFIENEKRIAKIKALI